MVFLWQKRVKEQNALKRFSPRKRLRSSLSANEQQSLVVWWQHRLHPVTSHCIIPAHSLTNLNPALLDHTRKNQTRFAPTLFDWREKKYEIFESTSLPNGRPLNWPAYQLIGLSTDQPNKWPACQLTSLTNVGPVNWPAYHLTYLPTDRPINWPACHLTNLPTDGPVNRLAGCVVAATEGAS